MPDPKQLSAEQLLLITLIVKLAVMATVATMLVRYRRFRHILIFERRGWPDRLVFVLFFGVPLAAGVVARNCNSSSFVLVLCLDRDEELHAGLADVRHRR